MNEFPNLRGNFRHILQAASWRDIHAMLCVLADHLQTIHPASARHVASAADLVSDKVEQLGRLASPREHLSPLPPHEGAGGERPKS
jgi:hypothetical protein